MGWFQRLPRQKAGKPIAARTINQIADAAETMLRLRVAPPLTLSMTAAGPSLRLTSIDAVYFCQPSGSVTGATGTWPTITPVSFTADIYKVLGTKIQKYRVSAKIYNWYAASLDANKTTKVEPDGSGSFVVVDQSCT